MAIRLARKCLLLAFLTTWTLEARFPRASDDLSPKNAPSGILGSSPLDLPVVEGQLAQFVADDNMQIIDANEEDEEEEGDMDTGHDINELESVADDPRNDFLQDRFPPVPAPFITKSDQSHPERPFIQLNKEMQNVTHNQQNKSVRFFCDINGHPIPNITWYHGNKRIESGNHHSKYRIKIELWGSVLQIRNAGPEDYGSYTCAAENAGGNCSTTAWFLPKQRQTPLPSSESGWPVKSMHSSSESENGFCQIFQSNVCVRYLNGHRVYVSTLLHQTLVEQQISKLISSAMLQKWHPNDTDCMGRIMEATCYYHFPICPPPGSVADEKEIVSRRRRLCREDCLLITKGQCSDNYNRLLRDTQTHASAPKVHMDCNSLPPYDPNDPESCLKTGSRPPVPDLRDLISNPKTVSPQKLNDSSEWGQGLDQKTQPPDLLPLFISFGVLILITLVVLLICFVYRRPHGGYSNDVFSGGSRAMRTICVKAGAVGKKQQGGHMNVQNAVEMKHPIQEINACPAETAPFMVDGYPTATPPNLDRRMSPNQAYHRYQTPQNMLMIPPPNPAAPRPPSSSAHSPTDFVNHRPFTAAFMDRDMDGGEKQFFIANNTFFNYKIDTSQPMETAPEPMDRPLQTINYPLGQIKFGDRIGQGVFGPVYAGELVASSDYENSKPTPLVIKTLSPGAPASMQTDFRREAKIMAELNHPNLLGIFGVSLQQPPWCMLFETPLYGDLHEVLLAARRSSDDGSWSSNPGASQTWPRNQQLLESDRFHIAFQIASGMEYLSRNHFIHRDLAARNVTVGEKLLCKITDLGLARDSYAMDYYRVPAANNLLLPVRWMPTDAILYSRFSVESDVWAFGVLLWEIWTEGMRPYHLYSDSEVIDLIQSRYLLPCPQNCPLPVYNLMVECWNEVGAKRPLFQEILSCLSACQHEMYALDPSKGADKSMVYTNTFPTSRVMDLNSTNTCSHSGDSGKTNSTDVSTERPASQRISSVPMPIMANLENSGGAVELNSNNATRQSPNYPLGPRPATTGANNSNSFPVTVPSPAPMSGSGSPLYATDSVRAV